MTLTMQAERGPGLRPDRLTASARDLEHLAAALFTLCEHAPARLTLRQALAFSICAYADSMGRAMTMRDLREVTDGVIGQSIQKTIQMFFEPSRDYPDALRWLEQVPDEDDRRLKYLKLTKLGRQVSASIVDQLRGGSVPTH